MIEERQKLLEDRRELAAKIEEDLENLWSATLAQV